MQIEPITEIARGKKQKKLINVAAMKENKSILHEIRDYRSFWQIDYNSRSKEMRTLVDCFEKSAL